MAALRSIISRLTLINVRSCFHKFKFSSKSITKVLMEGSTLIHTEAMTNQQMLSLKWSGKGFAESVPKYKAMIYFKMVYWKMLLV